MVDLSKLPPVVISLHLKDIFISDLERICNELNPTKYCMTCDERTDGNEGINSPFLYAVSDCKQAPSGWNEWEEPF